MHSCAAQTDVCRCRVTAAAAAAAGFAATRLWHKSQRSYPAALLFNVAEEWFAQHAFYGALPALYALTEPKLQGGWAQGRGGVVQAGAACRLQGGGRMGAVHPAGQRVPLGNKTRS